MIPKPPSDMTILALTLYAAAGGCSSDVTSIPRAQSLDIDCSIPLSEVFDGGPGKDGIPALTNPPLVPIGDEGIVYLRDVDRVIGLEWEGQPIAVPLNIAWWHEVVNLDLEGLRVAVTHCPLTGSSLAFDRSPADGATFGVSGLLYLNNLIMYDRNDPESLWPQMARGARCGVRDGKELPMIAVVDLTWRGWRTLHPNTLVVSSDNGYVRDYRDYPYGDYDDPDNSRLLFPLDDLDRRRPPKERVLGIPSGDGSPGIAFPFGELAAAGRATAISYKDAELGPLVVFSDAEYATAMAFRPLLGPDTLTFESDGSAVVDVRTRSTWTVDGHAVAGPLAGSRLEQIADAHVAFWFAWAAFHPETVLWTAPPKPGA